MECERPRKCAPHYGIRNVFDSTFVLLSTPWKAHQCCNMGEDVAEFKYSDYNCIKRNPQTNNFQARRTIKTKYSNLQNLVEVSKVVDVEWLRAKSFRYSCLVRVAIAANFSERSAAISPFMAAVKEFSLFHDLHWQLPLISCLQSVTQSSLRRMENINHKLLTFGQEEFSEDFRLWKGCPLRHDGSKQWYVPESAHRHPVHQHSLQHHWYQVYSFHI